MLKYLILLGASILVGCAGQPEKNYQLPDMTSFKPNCRIAKAQLDYLSEQLDEYSQQYKTHPTTLESRRVFGRMKNALWSLRSSCSAPQL
jgi:uncharacterized lipoprotein YmbA